MAAAWSIAAFIAIIAAFYAQQSLLSRPSLDAYKSQHFDSKVTTNSPHDVTFLGTTTMLFDDGESSIMTDGFFTRPSFMDLIFRKIEPSREIVTGVLDRLEIKNKKLLGVACMHSHFDHAMDSPLVCEITGSKLIGSKSTAMIGKGWGLEDDQITIVKKDGDRVRLSSGDSIWDLTFAYNVHTPVPDLMGGDHGSLTEPLVPPVRFGDYKVGDVYSLFIEHSKNGIKSPTVLVQGSAGFIPGRLYDSTLPSVDVVFLGVGFLGRKKIAYKDTYWNETVTATKAKRVIIVHHDDFTSPLSKSTKVMPRLLDRFDKTMEYVFKKGKEQNVDVRIMDFWETANIFAGL